MQRKVPAAACHYPSFAIVLNVGAQLYVCYMSVLVFWVSSVRVLQRRGWVALGSDLLWVNLY